ncbi:S8 family serine peptidase [Planctobacterium marinum]|uniref:Peptidase S8/S53 domain-containing protein n=1 Tax=Planctobacterium marinum TaxID=1631968 RepID=A0AA48KMR9_9ALTE|nr:hypothetical protein MACH26_02470 [Planctobacterium marinum]
MNLFKGAAVQNIIKHKQAIMILRVYQCLFGFAVVCVTLFSFSFAQANERSAERRAELMTERMLDRQVLRAAAMAGRLSEEEAQKNSIILLERDALLSTERQLEKVLEARVLDRNAESNRDADIPTRPTPEEPDPESETNDSLGDGLGSFDPNGQTDTGDKSNDEVEEGTEQSEDALEEQLEDSFAEQDLNIAFSDLQFEQTLHAIENDTAVLKGIDEQRVWTNEWVIMADVDAKSALEKEGYEFSNEEHLESFGSIIASVKAPATYDLHNDYQLVMKKLDKHDAVLDLNHIYSNIYTNASEASDTSVDGISPGELLSLPGQGTKIGMVDTAINLEHSLLKDVMITQQHFTQDNQSPVFTHGTAVASVLSGKGPQYQGILKQVELFNASVFVEAKGSQSITTALSLLRGLNWLVQQDIKVINMSLAGPPNRLLEKGIEQLCQKGVIIVAAAGNEGPFSKPMYPAGYSCAVAVTAVDLNNKIYKKAVRGNHIDVAAYGVNILAAGQENSTIPQSGTSMAAPFVSAWIASQLPSQKEGIKWVELALDNCLDLGEEGFDPLYGKGLLPFEPGKLANAMPQQTSKAIL